MPARALALESGGFSACVSSLADPGRTETSALTERDKAVARHVYVIARIAHTPGSPVRASLPVCSSQKRRAGNPPDSPAPGWPSANNCLAICQFMVAATTIVAEGINWQTPPYRLSLFRYFAKQLLAELQA